MTHGVEVGVARAASRDLAQATQTLIDSFVRGNDGMRQVGAEEYFRLSGRNAIVTPLVGRSALGGNERVDVHTTMLNNGDLFYLLTVVPEREGGTYAQAFDRVVNSVRINDR
jgi:hypothetical protein